MLIMAKIFILVEKGYCLTSLATRLANKFTVKFLTVIESQKVNYTFEDDAGKIDNPQLFNCQGTSFKDTSLLAKSINSFSRVLTIFWRALTMVNQDDILLVFTDPPMLPAFALLLKWIKRCKIILVIYDLYPEALIATGLIQKNSFIANCIEYSNYLIYNNSSKIITVSRELPIYITNKYTNLAKDKIVFIPSWVEDSIACTTKENNLLLQELKIIDKFVVLHAGNMGRTHDIELIAAAAKIFNHENSQIHFLFIGSGAKKKWLEEFIINNNISNISVVPYQVRAEINTSINAGDIAIISYLPEMSLVSAPSRMYNQMAAGKLIIGIADKSSELAQVIEEEQAGWIISPNNVTQLVGAIDNIYRNENVLSYIGNELSNRIKYKYTFEKSMISFEENIAEVLAEGANLKKNW
jgi:colanic acid biosynthesis glycosyl transferase WcaI